MIIDQELNSVFDLQQLPETEDLFLWKQFTKVDRVNQNRKCTVKPKQRATGG